MSDNTKNNEKGCLYFFAEDIPSEVQPNLYALMYKISDGKEKKRLLKGSVTDLVNFHDIQSLLLEEKGKTIDLKVEVPSQDKLPDFVRYNDEKTPFNVNHHKSLRSLNNEEIVKLMNIGRERNTGSGLMEKLDKILSHYSCK